MSRPADPSRSETKTCPNCGLPFTRLRSRPEKYCSRTCRETAEPSMLLEKTCPACGKAFNYYASWPRKYCSNQCAAKFHPAPTRYTTNCEQCGKPYETTPTTTHGRFCSHACHGVWLTTHAPRGPAHPRWTGGPKPAQPTATWVKKTCPICTATFLVKPSHAERRWCCSRTCGAIWQTVFGPRGEDHPTWAGGYEPYYGTSWRQARRLARLRDVICGRCGKAREGRALDVHHIIPFRCFGAERHAEANALTNLISLCPKCHLREEWTTNRQQRPLPPRRGKTPNP